MRSLLSVVLYLGSATASALPGWGGPSYDPPEHGGGHAGGNNNVWDLEKFSALVAFGDSYTDDSRFLYFYTNNGSAPPVGWISPPNNNSADGGYPWPDYVHWYTGARIYNYAVNGASCTNDISPRYFAGINGNFPDIEHYEVPAWIADSKYVAPDGTKALDTPQDETVYSMWIGTNELDIGEMLTDSQVPGTNISTYMDCVFEQLQRIYDNGARYFVLQNVQPLQLTPLVAAPENGGVGPNHYWPDKPDNLTAISLKMMQMVWGCNEIYQYRTPFELLVAKKFPGARFALMDMYGLVLDIWNNPTEYLNGTAPANNTGFINHCSLDGLTCVRQESPDSYLWYDESHPSEQTDRIIARTFVDVVKGTSKWATYWSS
ncbi:carbohydrate esterase family 16 protein [Aulographum hederae CBS 113979]|uniref:Carbohydrate esterase family 16 protein n=1 Tax=Aulographum hederae CBS 113979 TaxID=1176131 RepID=A0A6G1HG92_9PEZI|nr:carbohydrate esterase family 16 protein [Aulographum hederae CBS 113979]